MPSVLGCDGVEVGGDDIGLRVGNLFVHPLAKSGANVEAARVGVLDAAKGGSSCKADCRNHKLHFHGTDYTPRTTQCAIVRLGHHQRTNSPGDSDPADEFVICRSHLFAQHAVAAVEDHDEPVQLHRAFDLCVLVNQCREAARTEAECQMRHFLPQTRQVRLRKQEPSESTHLGASEMHLPYLRFHVRFRVLSESDV